MEYETLTEEHLARLGEIRADYVSDRYLRVVKASGDGTLATGYTLQADKLHPPFRSQGLSIVRAKDRDEIAARMAEHNLQLVVEEDGRLIAFLDAEVEQWRGVLKVWNLLVDEERRRRGIGTELMRNAERFGAQNHCRAIAVEAQATNWPAMCFYAKMGFCICGVDDHFYTNRDLERKEVALFLYRELP
jgi:ribosomal protein S18 acetylase RimI-like enzyme